ncbi:MAG: hybrid sensor histidine kinase/response regulator [Anaerolineales bacterium]|nr:hybrid sensor histidine kinase/response regulator [Anaerolineales bacterium]
MQMEARILVIDDEVGIRRGCRRVLEPLGIVVEAAGTLEEGRQKIETNVFDLILLDVMLPDGRGTELLPVVKNYDPEIVVVIITGFATVELAVEAIKQGAYDFIAKPFDPDLLEMTVRQGLEKRRLSLEAERAKELELQANELAREKEEMERVNEFKTSFTLMVAHELRAPVSALLSLLRTVNRAEMPAEKREEILQRSIKRAEEMLELINDLLSLAAARQLEPEAEATPIQVVDLLEKVADLLAAQAEERQIEFDLVILARPVVRGYADQIEQLWMNLISNAIKYTAEGGRVTVRVDVENDWAVASVEDSGIGIEADLKDKIFEDFYRTPQAKAFNHLGTGLGLTLVKQILDSHGGHIEVQSEPGKGSTFRFRIPLEEVFR